MEPPKGAALAPVPAVIQLVPKVKVPA